MFVSNASNSRTSVSERKVSERSSVQSMPITVSKTTTYVHHGSPPTLTYNVPQIYQSTSSPLMQIPIGFSTTGTLSSPRGISTSSVTRKTSVPGHVTSISTETSGPSYTSVYQGAPVLGTAVSMSVPQTLTTKLPLIRRHISNPTNAYDFSGPYITSPLLSTSGHYLSSSGSHMSSSSRTVSTSPAPSYLSSYTTTSSSWLPPPSVVGFTRSSTPLTSRVVHSHVPMTIPSMMNLSPFDPAVSTTVYSRQSSEPMTTTHVRRESYQTMPSDVVMDGSSSHLTVDPPDTHRSFCSTADDNGRAAGGDPGLWSTNTYVQETSRGPRQPEYVSKTTYETSGSKYRFVHDKTFE